MRGWRITKAGIVVLLLLVAAVLGLTFASGGLRVASGVVLGATLLLFVSEGMSGAGDRVGATGRKREVLAREAQGSRPTTSPPPPGAFPPGS